MMQQIFQYFSKKKHTKEVATDDATSHVASQKVLNLGIEKLIEEYNFKKIPADSFTNVDMAKVIYFGVNTQTTRSATRKILEKIADNSAKYAFHELGVDYSPIVDILEQPTNKQLLILLPSFPLQSNLYASLKELKSPAVSFIETWEDGKNE